MPVGVIEIDDINGGDAQVVEGHVVIGDGLPGLTKVCSGIEVSCRGIEFAEEVRGPVRRNPDVK